MFSDFRFQFIHVFFRQKDSTCPRPEALCAPSLAIRPWTCHHHHTCSAAARRVEGCARCELFPAPPRLHFSYTSSHGLSATPLRRCMTHGEAHVTPVEYKGTTSTSEPAWWLRWCVANSETTAKQAPKLSEHSNCCALSKLPRRKQSKPAPAHWCQTAWSQANSGSFQPGVLHCPTNLE